MTRRHKTDTNQAEIVRMLRDLGATVQDLSAVGGGCPDLLVAFQGKMYTLEIKNPSTHGKLSMTQKMWHANWRGHVAVVRTVDDALREIGVME